MRIVLALRQWLFEATMTDHDKALAHFKDELIDFRLRLSEIHYEIMQAQSAVDTILTRLEGPTPKPPVSTGVPALVAPERPPRRFDSEHRQVGV
mgnify:CR=1 FL=1